MRREDAGRNQADSKRGETAAQFEWDESVQPTAVVVEAVATHTGRDPTEFGPLYEAVDTDALNQLVGRATAGHRSSVSLSFTYENTDVLVDSRTGVEVVGDAD